MEKNNWIFLTRQEVLDAIAIDFQQYGPQPLIFREIAPLILKSRYRIIQQGKDTSIWIQPGRDYPLQKIDDKDLGFYFSHILETTKYPLKILARIKIVHKSGKDIQYRIWQDHDTGVIARICPWLMSKPQEQGFTCLIQDIKPEVCQQYPFTRKHAVMTGCKGEFQKPL
ncbi:hypothetical protein [Desulfobacula sp.]|uniref:hypothetical protein n=1 Tax=Desulfobacula sp. TaxID=2593537 RepID=UPI001ED4E858|nr:hypothetical protein [Desulfobacula sp.]